MPSDLRADVALRTGHYAAAADLARRSGKVPLILDRAAGRAPGPRPGVASAVPGQAHARSPGKGANPPPADQLSALPPGRLHRPEPVNRARPAGRRPRPALRDPGRVSRSATASSARRQRSDIDGVPYHRLVAGISISSGPSRIVEATVRAGASLVERLRPAAPAPRLELPQCPGRAGPSRAVRAAGRLRSPWLPRGDVGPRRDRASADATDADRYGGREGGRNRRHDRRRRRGHALGDDAGGGRRSWRGRRPGGRRPQRGRRRPLRARVRATTALARGSASSAARSCSATSRRSRATRGSGYLIEAGRPLRRRGSSASGSCSSATATSGRRSRRGATPAGIDDGTVDLRRPGAARRHPRRCTP